MLTGGVRESLKGGALFLLLLFLFNTAYAGDALEELLARQKGVSTVRAEFSQEKRTLLLEKPIADSGVFYYMSEAGVRWQYREGLLVIYDGAVLYVFDPETGEAEKVTEAGGYIGPLSFDIGFLRKDYEIRAERLEGAIRLDLKPKKQMPFVSMEITFPAGAAFPGEVVMREETGDVTRIEFSDVRINEPLSDELFVFRPPPGVKLRERSLQ